MPLTENSPQNRTTEARPGAIEVLGVGYSCTDFIATVAAMPEIDTKTAVESLHVQGGGPAATALVTLARLGARTALIAKTGDDLPGRMAVAELAREAVDTSGVIVQRGAQSQCSFILIDEPTGRRTVFWTRGSVDAMAPSEIDPGMVRSARYLLVDDLESAAQEAAARQARDAGIPVVMDAGSVRDGVENLVPLATHLVASEGFPPAFTGVVDPMAAASAILEMGPEVVVVTLGARGCLAIDRGGVRLEQPGYRVKAVDTLGAGDVFHGAYVRGLLEGWELPRVLEFACAVAALKCTKHGGREGIPSMAEAAAFLGW
jgi:sulfofructose kinase